MTLGTALAVAALVASIALVMQLRQRQRLYPILSAVASGLLVLSGFGVLGLGLGGLPLGLILAVAIAITGGLTYMRVSSKPAVAEATVVTIAGVLLTLAALGIG